MPTAASITVKKADGTTDIVWNLVGAAGGDKTPAVWRQTSTVGTVGQRPTMTETSKSNADGTVRRLDLKVSFPSVYTDTSSSLSLIRSTMNATLSVAVPQDVADADLNEFAAQAMNLFSSSLVKSSIVAGYAPA